MVTDLMLASVMILIVLAIILNLICLAMFVSYIIYDMEHPRDE